MTNSHPRNDHLRDERKRQGLTQVQLALKAGINQKYISMLEAGDRGNPGIHIAYAVADALNKPVLDIFPRPHMRATLSGNE